ncbi:sperm acrosome membrane-associated protein 1 [Manacus candei]|uniref:sperm acrosome membrane-associated protein 1 n=1 Tax=Manacus candei TaxID=415023 RepID=UPI0022261819|nr:sperm acrosome membrane-associated protein 1 [Manacus candei]
MDLVLWHEGQPPKGLQTALTPVARINLRPKGPFTCQPVWVQRHGCVCTSTLMDIPADLVIPTPAKGNFPLWNQGVCGQAARRTEHILPNGSAIIEFCRGTHSVTFQCETQENGNIVASVKYTVYTTTEMQTKKTGRIESELSRRMMTDPILVFCLISGIILIVDVIFAAVVKSIWKSKSEHDNQEKITV